MMNQQEFTAAVLAAGAHPLPGGQSHGGQRGGLRRRGAAGHPAGLGAAGHPAPAPVFPHVAHPDPHQRVQGNSPPTGAAGPYDQAAAEAIPAPAEEDHSDLYAALGALEEKYRLPVVMYYWEGFKTREIASLLRLPEGTVKSRLRTARIQLRDTLKGACFA